MVEATKSPQSTSLRSLVSRFVLTKRTDGKSPRTVQYYDGNLSRFLWYAEKEGWPDDIYAITEWHIREFLGYVASGTSRWGLQGNGSERCQPKASHSTVHHYFSVLKVFWGWCVERGFLTSSPVAKIKVSNAKPRVIQPYSSEDIAKMLAVCNLDYQHNAKLLGSRNNALILMLLDTGLRVSEVANIRLADVDTSSGWIKVMGKGSKERVVKIGQVVQKALSRYLIHRPVNGRDELWLTEIGQPLKPRGVQMVIEHTKQRGGVQTKGNAHRFRHTFALNFLRADRNPFNLQYLLGHSDLRMVRHYTATLGMQDALEAHVKASPADMFGRR